MYLLNIDIVNESRKKNALVKITNAFYIIK